MKEAIKTITLLVFVVGMVGCELLGDSSDHYPVSAKINGVLYKYHKISEVFTKIVIFWRTL